MNRFYTSIALEHLRQHKQMLFLFGPRQVGKTTIAKTLQNHFNESIYLNWDVVKDRRKILEGQDFIEGIFSINQLRQKKPLVIFDEIHKFKNWKNYLKGFYDRYGDFFHILVTGSARLDLLNSKGDSLLGRYFILRIYPFSVREIIDSNTKSIKSHWDKPIQHPENLDSVEFENLYNFGGFPDPYLKENRATWLKWQKLKTKQLFREDIRETTQVQDIAKLEVLGEILKEYAGCLLNRTDLSKKLQVTVQTISRWIELLGQTYYCFTIQPWHKNVIRSLVKEPKLYLHDWSIIEDEGKKVENFLACHLLKAVHFWNDIGLGQYGLHYMRDKQKKEVDFLIVKDKKPWILVEAKLGQENKLSKWLEYFQEMTNAQHAYQVSKKLDYVHKDCFEFEKPMIVPAKTFLSQLV